MATNILTEKFKYHSVEELTESVANNHWYFFVGDHIPRVNSDPDEITNSLNDTLLNPYYKMVMGKKVSNTDICPVVRNIPWENKIFDMYDDDVDLTSLDYYTIVAEGSFFHVWKCLDNNNNANSTVSPSFASGSNTTQYQTSDGYRWKYMTSVDGPTVSKFGTIGYFPIVANTSVANNAVDGRIDVIKLDANQYGSGYDNYVDGTLRAADLLVDGDSTLFNISNNIASTTNGFYTGCNLYLTSGVGQGQYKTVVDYVSNSTGNLIKLESAFLTVPVNGTTYQLRPAVAIVGDGTQTVNCVARALVNTTNGNSIHRIEVLQFGAGYTNATANVVANSVVGVPANDIAIIRPIISPNGGHGKNIFTELGCHNLSFGVTLQGNENSTLPTSNLYQQIGLIKNPEFQNVKLTFANSVGNFSNGETVHHVTRIQLNTNCTANIGNNQISTNNANWYTQVVANDYLLVSTQDGLVNEFVQVSAFVNSSTINVSSNNLFTCTQTIVYALDIKSSADVISVTNSTVITVSNVTPTITFGSQIVGSTSGAFADVSSVTRNNVLKYFDTFIELHKYSATLVSGTFVENEVVIQGSSSGYVHHVDGTTNIDLFISGMSQLFTANSTVTGNTSGAVANVSTFYDREVQFGTGDIMYLENISAVTRANTQSELFQIIINF